MSFHLFCLKTITKFLKVPSVFQNMPIKSVSTHHKYHLPTYQVQPDFYPRNLKEEKKSSDTEFCFLKRLQ